MPKLKLFPMTRLRQHVDLKYSEQYYIVLHKTRPLPNGRKFALFSSELLEEMYIEFVYKLGNLYMACDKLQETGESYMVLVSETI